MLNHLYKDDQGQTQQLQNRLLNKIMGFRENYKLMEWRFPAENPVKQFHFIFTYLQFTHLSELYKHSFLFYKVTK